MSRHDTRLASIYAVGIAAALLSLVAWIGLFSRLLSQMQIVVIAALLAGTIVMTAFSARHWSH